MKHYLSPLAILASLALGPLSLQAADGGHCEKKAKDGTVSNVEAKDKKACKKKGGTWVDAPKADEVSPAEAEAPPAEETN